MPLPRLRRRPSTSPTRPRDAELAFGNLPARTIAGRVIGAATPTTVVAGVVPVGIAVTGGNFPLLWLLIGLAYLLFCVGYHGASRLYPPEDASGGFYSLIRHGLGRVLGVGAGWVAVAAYTALTVGLYGLVGSILATPVSDLLGVTVPWPAIAIASVLLVGWLGLLRIEVASRVLTFLVTCEVAMILVVSAANWGHPAANTQPLAAAFDPHQLTAGVPVIAAQLALAVLGIVGTELTVVHTYHARDGHRGVARASIAAIVVLAALYFVASAGLSVTLGVDGVVAAAQANPAGLFVATAQAHLGDLGATIVEILFAGSVLAGALSFHGTTALYGYYLGRDHAAPAVLAKVSRKYGNPVTASLAQTVLALAAIVIVWVLGADPVTTLFYLGGTTGGAGVLILLAGTALASAVILLRQRPTGRRRAAAAVAAVFVIGAIAGSVLLHLDVLFGVGPDSTLPSIVQLSYLAVALAGVGWALCHRRPPAATATIDTGAAK
ncbi:APC family permease [Amycolatopsis sp. NEAU-NG30]|uniref:APC family permease n=1 Tax=Amycolatopsis melonis TaxID=3156488 RepID=A0ABV0LEK0_9PSEU